MATFQSSYELDSRLVDLVAAGVVNVSCVFTRSGVDVWVRTTQPHPRLGVYTHESMTPDEAIKRLAKIPGSKVPTLKPSSLHKDKGDKGDTVVDVLPAGGRVNLDTVTEELKKMTLEEAKLSIGKRGLDKVKTVQGVWNALPDDSITRFDLHKSINEFFARLVAVSARIGEAKAVARIATVPDLMVGNVATLAEWWDRATPKQRLRLVSNQKKLDINEVHADLLNKVKVVPCPFRDHGKSAALDENYFPVLGHIKDVYEFAGEEEKE